jgi:hypothetical protein
LNSNDLTYYIKFIRLGLEARSPFAGLAVS